MYGFDKTRRLLSKSDYDVVFKQAEKLVVSEFIFLYRSNTVGHARLGLAISKKALSKAHDRNRIKRLLRETFRNNTNISSVDVIVLIRGNVKHVQNKDIIKKLERAWNKLVNSCEK